VKLTLAPRKVIRRRNQVALAILWSVGVGTAHPRLLSERNVGSTETRLARTISTTLCMLCSEEKGARNHFMLTSPSSHAGRTSHAAQSADQHSMQPHAHCVLRSNERGRRLHFTPSLRRAVRVVSLFTTTRTPISTPKANRCNNFCQHCHTHNQSIRTHGEYCNANVPLCYRRRQHACKHIQT
jgi:hypothetical protein